MNCRVEQRGKCILVDTAVGINSELLLFQVIGISPQQKLCNLRREVRPGSTGWLQLSVAYLHLHIDMSVCQN